MKKKIIVLVSALAVIIGSLGIFTITTGAATPTPELSIDYCNLSFQNNVCVKYAVKSNISDVKVLIWTEPQKEYVVGTQNDEITTFYSESINGTSYKIFDYKNIFAKQMTDVIYACAYVEVDNVDYYSDINKYSILQYAYNKLGKTGTASTDVELKDMLAHMLEYGAGAQKYLNDYKVDRLATDNWYQVKITGGMLEDGCTHGLYLPGDKVTMTALEMDDAGASFAYWADSKGNQIGTTAAYELTVGNKNESYKPVYIKYSNGLEFDSNGDGTCYVVGMGDCTDKDLVIPSVSPDGDIVMGIDGSAFAGEEITSVSIPNTIEEIGRKAFNGCTELTDVYYDGTEEEWNNISISAGNTPIESATKHFKEVEVESYTVTFVDYNGTVLKTETVNSGESATAPADPSRDGYTFVGWDKTYSNVTGDLTITAMYEEISSGEPTIAVKNVTAKAGESIEVPIMIMNNPGVAGAKITISYDSSLNLNAAESGDAFAYLQYTGPGKYVSPCNFTWDSENGMATENGTILILTFDIPADASIGETYDIACTYRVGDIYDEDLEDLIFEVISGVITVE